MMQPPNIPRGTPVDTGLFERLVSGLFQRIVAGPGISVSRASQGIQISASQGGGPEISPFAAVRITGVYGDYVTGVVINAVSGSDSGAEIAVAKPFQLRQTPFDGQTITFPNGDEISYAYDGSYPERKRVATINSVDYTEYITPMYNEDEEITVVRVPTGATGGYGEALFWADINDAARAWAVDQ